MFLVLRNFIAGLVVTTQALGPVFLPIGRALQAQQRLASFSSAAVAASWHPWLEATEYGAGTPTPDYEENEDYARSLNDQLRDSYQANPDGSFDFSTGVDPETGQARPTVNLTPSELTQSSEDQTEAEELRDMDGDHQGIVRRAYEDAAELDQELDGSSEGTPRGSAYGVMMSAENRVHPDLSNDPLVSASQSTFQNRGDLMATFGSCQEITTTESTSSSARVPEYRYCEQVNVPNERSSLFHDYEVFPIVRLVNRSGGGASPVSQSGSASCGVGCLEVYIGQIGDNYWGGSCTEHIQNVTLEIVRPEALIKAEIVDIRWDDHTELLINNVRRFVSPDGYPQTDPFCERDTSNQISPRIDITDTVRDTSTLDFTQRTQVADKGEAYAVVRITYDPKRLLDDRGYFPPEAYEGARNLDDGELCSNSFAQRVDNEDPVGVQPNECATFHGNVVICPSDFIDPVPTVQMSPFWRETLVSQSCTPHYGTYCWIDRNGQQQCYTQTPENTSGDNCPALESDPSCGFVRTDCVEGARGDSTGHCYVNRLTYDCGVNVNTGFTSTSTTTSCAGDIQCIGESCLSHERTNSDEFLQATAALGAVRQIASDSECDPTTGTCRVFPGTALECKKAVGGVQDCCNSGAAAPSMAQYIGFLIQMDKVNSAVGGLNVMQPVYGAWNAFKDTVAQNFESVWTEVTKPFTSVLDGIGGATASTTTTTGASGAATEVAADTFLDQTRQLLMKKTYELLNAISPDLANALFTTTTGASGTSYALGPGLQTAANFAGAIMGAYAAYQAALLLIQIAYACEETELELEVKRQLKVCQDYGSYCKQRVLGACVEQRYVSCCYNSPLSRIMMTQIYDQLGTSPQNVGAQAIGGSVGDPSNPYCGGLPIEDVDRVDFSAINLDEWIALLTIAGQMPDASNPPGSIDDRYSMNSMTGPGSALDTEAEGGPRRENAADRSRSRADTLNPSQANQDAANYFWNGNIEEASSQNQSPSNSGQTPPNQTGYISEVPPSDGVP